MMNAPTQGAALAPNVQILAIAGLIPSDTHIQRLRRERFDNKLIKELADSIGTVGLLQPILVRPKDGGHEIVAGERRWLAAKIARLTDIPASVRELTDDQVLEVQLIENLQREGLHELEEAEGYEELMKLKKISADAVADMVGRSRSYVFKRTKLLALCPEARKAFYAGTIDASKALLVARIGHHDTQRAALKDVTMGAEGWGGRRDNEPMTFREAQRHIVDNYMLVLKHAPFDVDDAALVPGTGTCQACPKRTGNQKDLFGDVKSGDVCTDPKCFDDKRQAHYAVARKSVEAQGKKVIHGDAAKKLLPNWQETRGSDQHRNELKGGYVQLDATTYTNGGRGRKVSDVLGPDYEPILIQHPGSGKIIEVATEQAVAKAAHVPGAKARAKPAAKKQKGPDVDAQLLERLVKAIHEKAPREFSKTHLIALAERQLAHLNTRQHERALVSAQMGWPKGALNGGGYYGTTSRIPANVASKMSARDVLLLLFQLTFLADRYPSHRKHLLKLFGIDETKTRELIIDERKAAAKATREAAKKKKGAR